MQEIAGELYLECGNLLIELAQTSFVGIIEVCSVALKSLVYFLHHFLLLMSEVSGIDVIIDLLLRKGTCDHLLDFTGHVDTILQSTYDAVFLEKFPALTHIGHAVPVWSYCFR